MNGRERNRFFAQERRSRIIQYLKEGTPFINIVELEGVTPRWLRKCIAEIKEEHPDIKYEMHRGGLARRQADELPPGLTNESQKFRSKLGDKLYLYRDRMNPERRKLSRLEVASRIGLPIKEQIKAEDRPYTHNWTIAEIQRLASQSEVPFREFILDLLT